MLEILGLKTGKAGPAAAQSDYALGAQLFREGRYAEALEHFLRVPQVELIGQLARYYLGASHRALGIEDLQAGRHTQALGHFKSAIELLGKKANLESYLTCAYVQTKRFDRLAQEMEKVAAGSREASDARKLSQAQWRAGRRAEAYLTLSGALRRWPGEAQMHLQMGLFLAAEERYDQSRASFAKAAEADCTCAEAHENLALVAAVQHDGQTAVRGLQRALQLKPYDVMIAYKLALAARAACTDGYRITVFLPEPVTPAPTSQARQLAQYVTAQSDFVQCFLDLPQSAVDVELFGLLRDILQIAIAQNPRYADLRYYCSRVLARLGCVDEAIEQAQEAVDINPKYVLALLQLSELLTQAKRQDAALEHLRSAIAAGADWPDVHVAAATLARQLNNVPQTQLHLRRALELRPDYAPARQALRNLAA